MPEQLVTVRLPKQITDALVYYVPDNLGGDTSISARVRYGIVGWLHDRGSCTDLPRVASTGRRRADQGWSGRPRRRRRRR